MNMNKAFCNFEIDLIPFTSIYLFLDALAFSTQQKKERIFGARSVTAQIVAALSYCHQR